MTKTSIPLYHNALCLNELFNSIFGQFGDSPAFSHSGGAISFAELDQKSRILAGWFQQHTDLKPGDRVAVQLPNMMQYPLAMIAIQRAGLVLVNSNPLYTPAELHFQLKDSGARALITFAPLARRAAIALEGTDVSSILITELGDLHPPVKGWLLNQFVRRIAMPFSDSAIPRSTRLKQVLQHHSAEAWQPVKQTANDLALLQYTGGTTGTPKGAMLTQGNLMANLKQLKDLLEKYTHSGQERLLQPLPLYHIYAFMLNLAFFSQGARTELVPNPKNIKSLVRCFQTYKPTVFAGINPLFYALLKQKRFKHLNFKHLGLTISGGMALSPLLGTNWSEVTGSTIAEGYGLTECSPVVSVNRPDNIVAGSVGPVLSNTQVRIIDDQGNLLPTGETGEIQVKGPQVMAGYWNQPEETQQVLSKDGWLNTGDIGLITQEGALKIIDRKKELICVSGFKVFPSELEALVCGMPEVEDCAAIGIPDAATGEKIKLYVMTHSTNLTPQTVRTYCKERLTAYKVPKCVEFCSTLPRTPVGKVLRRTLKEQALRQLDNTPRRKH